MIKRIILIFIVVSLFFISLYPTLPANTINTTKKNILVNQNIYNHFQTNENMKLHFEGYENNTKINTMTNGKLDFEISGFIAWWSPVPEFYDAGYRCISILIKNIGDEYNSFLKWEWINVSIYHVYTDHERVVEYQNMTSQTFTIFKDAFMYGSWHSTPWPNSKKPEKLRINITTSIEEKNYDNNEATVVVGKGVTINGNVYEQINNGDKKQIDEAHLICLAEEEHFLTFYDSCSVGKKTGIDYYTLCAPIKYDNESSVFNISAECSYGTQYKETEPLYGYDNTTLDFVFIKKARSNYKSILNIIREKFNNKIISRVLNYN